MKLQVTQENLNKALSSVSRVANSRGTLPILANVLLKTTANRLSVAATNLDIAITRFIGSKVSEEGAITVPARLMQDLVSSLPDGVIEIEQDDQKLKITTNNYQSTINGVNADDFPVMPAISKGSNFSLPSDLLQKALQQVIFAASSDESRPVLTGVYLHNIDGWLSLVATNSYSLAEKKLFKAEQTPNLLIPAHALQELLRVLGDTDEEVALTYDDQQVSFRAGEVELVTRLIEGKYPDVHKLIPQDFTTTATMNRAEFINIAKVSSLFARESAGSVTLRVDEKSQTLSIHSIASQLGENTASTTGKVIGGGEITLNSRYLLDGLHALDGEEVSFCFNGKLELSILKQPGADDYIHGIMPLKS